MPLGISSLCAYLRAQVPAAQVSAHDLNIDTWQRVARAVPEGPPLLAFLHTDPARFYDQSIYRQHQPNWRAVAQAVARVANEAARFVASGEIDTSAALALDAHVELILRTDPDIVGISVMYLDQVGYALALAKRIREADRGAARAGSSESWRGPVDERAGAPPAGRRIILGGAALSALRENDLLTACPYVDGLVLGEGETACAMLCRRESWDGIPGLVFRTAHHIRHNPNSVSIACRQLPPPDFSDLPLAAYFNPEPVLPALFSRGCDWRRCRFCSHNLSFAGYRRKRVDDFVAELETIVALHGVRCVYLADQYVGAQDAERLAWGLKQRGLAIGFQVMGRPTADYTPPRLGALAEAGCRWISWGVETASQRLLDLCGKGTRVTELEEVIRQASTAGIANLLMLIFGLPTSTDEDLWETIELLERLHDHVDSFTLSRFRLFERTAFARSPARYALASQGPEIMLTASGHPIRSRRLRFKEAASDGSLRPSRAALEIATVERRCRHLAGSSLLRDLPSEHYLLYADRRAGRFGLRSSAPPSPAPVPGDSPSPMLTGRMPHNTGNALGISVLSPKAPNQRQ